MFVFKGIICSLKTFCLSFTSFLDFPGAQLFLNFDQENDIERVQKVACHVILQDSYTSYHEALTVQNLENLKERRKP